MPLKSSTDMDNFINGSHKINLTYWSYHQIDQRLKWDFDSAWTKQSSRADQTEEVICKPPIVSISGQGLDLFVSSKKLGDKT